MLMLGQFLRFGIIGVSGFVVDTATVYALRGALGLYIAGVLAYLLAATSNWVFNRNWAFATAAPAPAIQQWLKFLLANSVGFVVNRGIYALAIWQFPLAAEQPIIALAAGTACGMIINFLLSRKVFASTSTQSPPNRGLAASEQAPPPGLAPKPALAPPQAPGSSSSRPSWE